MKCTYLRLNLNNDTCGYSVSSNIRRYMTRHIL